MVSTAGGVTVPPYSRFVMLVSAQLLVESVSTSTDDTLARMV